MRNISTRNEYNVGNAYLMRMGKALKNAGDLDAVLQVTVDAVLLKHGTALQAALHAESETAVFEYLHTHAGWSRMIRAEIVDVDSLSNEIGMPTNPEWFLNEVRKARWVGIRNRVIATLKPREANHA